MVTSVSAQSVWKGKGSPVFPAVLSGRSRREFSPTVASIHLTEGDRSPDFYWVCDPASFGFALGASHDPIAYAGGLNLYEYVGDSPVAQVDPAGLAAVWNEGVMGYPADPNSDDGLTPSERNAACTKAFNSLSPEAQAGVHGFVTTCNGKRVICINLAKRPYYLGKPEDLSPEQNAANEIIRCKLVHEKTHFPDMEPPSPNTEGRVCDMKDPKDILEKRRSECRAMQAEVDCLRAAKRRSPYPRTGPRGLLTYDYKQALQHQIDVVIKTSEDSGKGVRCSAIGMEIT
jgi:hypothetical protein